METPKRSDEEINAEVWCLQGWTFLQSNPYGQEIWKHEDGRLSSQTDLPDYCNDLNEAHKLEQTLGLYKSRTDYPLSAAVNEANTYRRKLGEICEASGENHPIHASGRQRTEAYVETVKEIGRVPGTGRFAEQASAKALARMNAAGVQLLLARAARAVEDAGI